MYQETDKYGVLIIILELLNNKSKIEHMLVCLFLGPTKTKFWVWKSRWLRNRCDSRNPTGYFHVAYSANVTAYEINLIHVFKCLSTEGHKFIFLCISVPRSSARQQETRINFCLNERQVQDITQSRWEKCRLVPNYMVPIFNYIYSSTKIEF